MRAYVEMPPGWGPGQIMKTAWTKAGYHVEEHRLMATGERHLVIRGAADTPPDSPPNRAPDSPGPGEQETGQTGIR